MATALSAMPKVNTLIDYSLIYKTNKRSAWDFLTGEMRHVKVCVKKYDIPESLKIEIILLMNNIEKILKFGLNLFGQKKMRTLKI